MRTWQPLRLLARPARPAPPSGPSSRACSGGLWRRTASRAPRLRPAAQSSRSRTAAPWMRGGWPRASRRPHARRLQQALGPPRMQRASGRTGQRGRHAPGQARAAERWTRGESCSSARRAPPSRRRRPQPLKQKSMERWQAHRRGATSCCRPESAAKRRGWPTATPGRAARDVAPARPILRATKRTLASCAFRTSRSLPLRVQRRGSKRRPFRAGSLPLARAARPGWRRTTLRLPAPPTR
mmetsp:Transcript_3932/g.16360  ORF Transcript_3932/g.16360 Transcript_3932/m.16360 type:complete len:240 (+) Transcript_3932:473-1192(+)